MKRGVEIVPEESSRLHDEDVYTPKKDAGAGAKAGEFGQKGSGSVSSTSTSASTGSLAAAGMSGGEQFGDDYHPERGFRDASQTLYAKKGDKKVTLQDFSIKKVIGRGSFGKVFLVEKKDSKEVYAMKSLRKDVILDYDQVESTKLEKEILM
jgi:serine/threonine protein kinase